MSIDCSHEGTHTAPCSIEMHFSPGCRSNTPSKIIADRKSSALFLRPTMPSAPAGASPPASTAAAPLLWKLGETAWYSPFTATWTTKGTPASAKRLHTGSKSGWVNDLPFGFGSFVSTMNE